MSGIYIHIPFCKQACVYCDFHFSTSTKNKQQMVEAIASELTLRNNFFLSSTKISTIYFGGGTPSLLTEEELSTILTSIKQHFEISDAPEITLEVNPDDVNYHNLDFWKKLGINRLSIGIQSFNDSDLQFMHRAHKAEQAISSVKMAQEIGIKNISIDLIYGLPNQTITHWKDQIKQAIELGVPHISAYNLTVEPKTELNHLIKKGKIELPEDDLNALFFSTLVEELEQAGYDHYEISNFGKQGLHSKHNSSYWDGIPFLGVGPSAHSFDGSNRFFNVANNALYLKDISQNKLPITKETLQTANLLNERILTGMRTAKGLNLDIISTIGGSKALSTILKEKAKLSNYWFEPSNTHLILSKTGKLFADYIAQSLFFDDDFEFPT